LSQEFGQHYVFVIHQRARIRSILIQWNFAILMHVKVSDFSAAGVARSAGMA
jgi:hypothetical protein